MTIDGIDIATMGLHLSYLNGHLDQPARKKNLSNLCFEAGDLVYDAKEPVIDLVGYYPTKAALGSAITEFSALIRSQQIHAFNMGGHNVIFNGVVVDGVKIETIKTMVKLKFKVTITE